MYKPLHRLRVWLGRLSTRDRLPDPIDRLCPREWADLPTTHPATEAGCRR